MRNSSKLNRMLLVSASIPAALLVNAGAAWAADVNVTASEPAAGVGNVNDRIATKMGTQGSVSVDVTSTGDVTSDSTTVLIDGSANVAGQGDGAITVTNAGKLYGLQAIGTGDKTKSGNTFTGTNSGEITFGNFEASNFGGNVSLTNQGKVAGAVNGYGWGDVTIVNGSKATVGDRLDAHAYGDGNVSITNDGSVTNDIHGEAQGDGTVTIANMGDVGTGIGGDAYGKGGVSITNDGSVGTSVYGYAYGDGDVTIDNTGEVGTYVDAQAGKGAITITNSGKIGDYVDASTDTGAISFANASSGRVSGDVDLTSNAGKIDLSNKGEVLGTTTAISLDTVSTSAAPVVTVSGTTTTTVNSGTFGTTGDNVTGTYAGINGSLNFSAGNDGSVTQVSGKDSTATVTGTVYGDVTSVGVGFAGKGDSTNVVTDNRDGAGTGSVVTTNDVNQEYATTAGNSKVDITGTVAVGDSPRNGDVTSFGTTSSAVNVNGGKVSGDVTSASLGGKITIKQSSSTTQEYVTFVSTAPASTDSSASQEFTLALTGGDASVDLTGASVVGGDVNVIGVSSATANVGSKANVGGSAFVSTAVPGDISYKTSSSYKTDSKADGSATQSVVASVAAPAAPGNAVLNNAGRINGDADAQAGYGDATANITGTVGGSVSASTGEGLLPLPLVGYNAGVGSFEQTSDYAIVGGVSTKTTDTVKYDFTPAGGKASVVVDTAAALKGKGTPSVGGDVYASGIGGASVVVKAGNVVGTDPVTGGNVGVFSDGEAVSGQSVITYDKAGTTPVSVVSTETSKSVGGAASFSNDGAVLGNVEVGGLTSASLTNTGTLGSYGYGNDFEVYALGGERTVEVTDTNPTVPGDRHLVEKYSFTPTNGAATFTNSGVAAGDVWVAGATGTFTNNGIVTGTTELGVSQFSGTAVVDATITTTTVTVDPTVATQTYTADQNGVSGGFSVGGAVVTQNDLISQINSGTVALDPSQVDPSKFNLIVGGEAAVKTADIKATINLNNGSITLGDIDAQRADDGTFLTDTTVNLNGSGFLGASEFASKTYAADYTPVATLPTAAQGLFSTGGVRVLGVNTLNKTGAGTFVITGADYIPADGATPAAWTMDVGNFNIKAGEVQLDVGTDAVFGIKGNINNDATLVLGRRAPVLPSQAIGGNITNPTREVIDGITIYQQGNYNQSATGTTVVGINPSLIRENAYVNQSGSAPEILGPITGGVTINYFTAASDGIASTPSSVTVDGNLNLAGKVAVSVSKDSLYSNGDGYTLFTYTGTGAVTATVDSSISSNFVKFGLTHDATAKTVSLGVNRLSYATGATNPNAASAAVGLDSALADVITAIKTDNFTSVKDIANAQDIANIASALDWRLNAAQAAQVFNELSSAEIYGSLASVDQNSVFNSSLNRLTQRRGYGEALGTQLWFDPSASFVKTGGTKSGASKIKTNSYGGAFGIDVAYQDNGAIGIGFGYGQHDVNARGTPESAQVRTYTIGAYATQGFGPFYGNLSFAYGFSKFEVERDLTILARTIEGDFKGKQWDAALELGYDMQAGGNLVVTPFGKLAARHWSMNGFTEEGGAGIGLNVKGASKTVFNPTLGVKAGALLGDPEKVAYRPYAKVQYTFQGDVGNRRTVQYLGGGDAFQLRGVDPNGSGLVELGIDATVNKRVGLFLSGGLGFGGHTSSGQIRAGISFGF